MSHYMKEEELSKPVEDFLVAQGFSVNAEVHSCDITGIKGDILIVIELKTIFSLKLIYQAIERQKFADYVYIAVPTISFKQKKQIITLLKRLHIGLLLVEIEKITQHVTLSLEAKESPLRKTTKKRRNILQEASSRVTEYNKGGMYHKKRFTLYKQQSIEVAVYLLKLKQASPKTLRSFGASKKTQSILSSNFYGWFEKISRGVYTISKKGRNEIKDYSELVSYFTKNFKAKFSEIEQNKKNNCNK
jgi:hypothetical protein